MTSGQTHDLSIINQPVTSQAFFVPRLGNLVLWHFFDTFLLDNCTNKIPLLSRDNAAVIFHAFAVAMTCPAMADKKQVSHPLIQCCYENMLHKL